MPDISNATLRSWRDLLDEVLDEEGDNETLLSVRDAIDKEVEDDEEPTAA